MKIYLLKEYLRLIWIHVKPCFLLSTIQEPNGTNLSDEIPEKKKRWSQLDQYNYTLLWVTGQGGKGSEAGRRGISLSVKELLLTSSCRLRGCSRFLRVGLTQSFSSINRNFHRQVSQKEQPLLGMTLGGTSRKYPLLPFIPKVHSLFDTILNRLAHFHSPQGVSDHLFQNHGFHFQQPLPEIRNGFSLELNSPNKMMFLISL